MEHMLHSHSRRYPSVGWSQSHTTIGTHGHNPTMIGTPYAKGSQNLPFFSPFRPHRHKHQPPHQPLASISASFRSPRIPTRRAEPVPHGPTIAHLRDLTVPPGVTQISSSCEKSDRPLGPLGNVVHSGPHS